MEGRGSVFFPGSRWLGWKDPLHDLTCPDLSSLAVVVEEVPTPCAGGGAVGRVLCAQADSPCGGFAGMRRWPYVNGIAGPRVLRVRRWAESLGACSRLAACPPARRRTQLRRNVGEAVYEITDTACRWVCVWCA